MSTIWRTVFFVTATINAAMATKRNCTAPNMTSQLYIRRGTLKSSYRQGEWLYFSCRGRNHYLSGSVLRVCRGGSWTGTTPRCLLKRGPGVRCKKVPYFKNGRVDGSRRRVNAIIRFKCFKGYNLMGQKKLTCLATGKWSGPIPKCIKDVKCPDPGTPANGYRFGSSFKNGRTVKYSCNKDYKLHGPQTRTCQETGKWTGKPASCIKIDPLQELKDVAENLRKNFVNKFGLVTTDSRARAGISSGAAGLDFVFVVDSSASVGRKNFKRGIEFIKTIIDEYGVSSKPQGTRVAIVTFSSQATVRFNLKTKVMKDKHQAMKELGNIAFQGGGTNTAGALDKVFHVVAPEARKKSHKVLFLITDGRSNVGSSPRQFAERLRQKNFEIFAIGITKNADKRELRSIASQPYRSHVYLLADYKTLEKLKDMITGDGKDSWDCGLAGDTQLSGSLKTPDRKLAKEDAWPWQAAIYVETVFKCGGTLIADDWVLTSANCFDKNKIADLKSYHVEIVLGEHNRLHDEGTEQSIDAEKVIRPKKYSKKDRDDLALVKLKQSVKQTAFVHSICYDDDPSSSLIWPTQHGVITGWGSKKQSKNIPTIPANDELQQAVVKFVSNRECQKKTTYDLKGNVFCGTSKDNKVAECLGDTGGPVVAKRRDDTWALVGVMKINEGCFKGMKYSLFTKVGHYSKWISQTMLNN